MKGMVLVLGNRIDGKRNSDLKINIVLWVYCIGVFFASWILFYRQSIWHEGGYPSDLVVHLSVVHSKGFGYSLNSILFKCAYKLIPSYKFVTCVLAIVVVGTILLTVMLINDLTKTKLNIWTVLVAGTSVFIASVYVPYLYPFIYIRSYATQPWHNSTYLTMRLMGIVVLAIYFKIEEHYLEKITWKEWLGFTLLLSLTNYAKPNFLLGFAPMVLCFLICDFIKTRGKTVKQQLLMGVAVLASFIVLFYQSQALYDTSEKNGIAVSLDRINEIYEFPQTGLRIIMGFAFAICVFITMKRKKIEIPKYLTAGWIFAFFCYFFRTYFKETGARENHGNFSWQMYMGGFVVAILSFAAIYKAYHEEKVTLKNFCVCMCVYFLQIMSGLFYFYKLIMGESYLV